MNIPIKEQKYLKESVLLVNKMFKENSEVRLVLRHHICNNEDLKEFEKVMKLVTFDDSRKLPYDALAETDREIGPSRANYTIYINPRFKEQFNRHHLAIENHRLRFVLAITIFHELCHLNFRHNGIMHTPDRLMGVRVPEAGEFFENMVFGGQVSLRLSNDSKTNAKRGWVPKTMKVTAVLLRRGGSKLVTLYDSEIEQLFQCVGSNSALPVNSGGFLMKFDTKIGRKKGEHALKRTDGVHEGTRGKRYLAEARELDFDPKEEHILDTRCPLHKSWKKCRSY
jgi:hypothetical protein